MPGMYENGYGGYDIYDDKPRKRKRRPALLWYAPAWVRALILGTLAYSLYKDGLSITPNMQAAIDFIAGLFKWITLRI